jgi:hypothetical protein
LHLNVGAEEPRQGTDENARDEDFGVGIHGEARMFGNKEYGRGNWKEYVEWKGHAVA